jgi:DNA/RNA non-specific endonuclease
MPSRRRAVRSGAGSGEVPLVTRGFEDGSDVTRTRDLRRDKPRGEYPTARMRGFPLSRTEPRLVRGHLAAHTVGGGTDINLVPQDAAPNVSGAWRRLERWAQARPGTFLAVEVSYDDGGQTPARFVYLVAAERELRYELFTNR